MQPTGTTFPTLYISAACSSKDPGESCLLTHRGDLAWEEGASEEREAEGGVCEAAAA